MAISGIDEMVPHRSEGLDASNTGIQRMSSPLFLGFTSLTALEEIKNRLNNSLLIQQAKGTRDDECV